MKMEKDLNQTQATLIQITEAFKRTRQMLARRRTGDYLILWGVLISLGYALSQFFKGKESLNWFWLSLAGIGWVGTILITIRQIKMTKGKVYFPEGMYIGIVWISLVIYSLIWFFIINRESAGLSGIGVSLLLLNFMMYGYILMGIFLGKEMAFLGIFVTLSSIICGLYLREYFNYAMALIFLIAFVGGGILINRRWGR
jgi:hypothetical protein